MMMSATIWQHLALALALAPTATEQLVLFLVVVPTKIGSIAN